eukprot:TRINITY_DN290_c2_g1_i5.p1 TRINITY_DN290_c2_g1~~TRINITY_DN290_c2_g1_i5.p1  ORF type:complete len:322 (-),score=97.84 TRINITY_DN290_c2_g1_i5:964-1929(-)
MSLTSKPTPSAPSEAVGWRFHCHRVWSKALKDLPVAIDLPRLAPNTTIVDKQGPSPKIHFGKQEYLEAIFDYTSTNTIMSSGDVDLSFKKFDLFIFLERASDEWIRVDFNKTIGVVPADFVKPVNAPPASKDKRTFDILTTMVAIIEGEERGNSVKEEYYKYIPKDSVGDKDISRDLTRFLEEVVKEESPTLRVLKACNQATIAPAVIELTLALSKRLSFKDGGSWRIRVTVDSDEISVTHWKKQRPLIKPGEDEIYLHFEWELTLFFDKSARKITDFLFKLSDIEFVEGVEEEKKAGVLDALETYFTRAGGSFQVRFRNS